MTGSGLRQTWEQPFVSRLLFCLGMDARAPTVPIFAVENVPSDSKWPRDELADVGRLRYLPRSDLALQNARRIAWGPDLCSALIPIAPLLFSI